MSYEIFIYSITNKMNGNQYVGATKNFRARKSSHLGILRTNSHHSKLMQSDFNTYGESALVFEVIESFNYSIPTFQVEMAKINVEKYYIQKLMPAYNTTCKTPGKIKLNSREEVDTYLELVFAKQKKAVEEYLKWHKYSNYELK